MPRTSFIAVSIVVSLLLTGCCATTEQAALPDSGGPEMATAGWESTGGSTAAIPAPAVGPAHPAPAWTAAPAARPTEDMTALRSANQKLLQQVTKLRSEVQTMKESRAAPVKPEPAPPAPVAAAPETASAPVRGPAPSHVVSVESVRGALLDAGVTDLVVAKNAEGLITLTLPGKLSFASGKAELSAGAKSMLLRLSTVLKRDLPGVRLRVEGHTDSDPIRKSSWGSNEALSAARAEAVARHLAGAGGISGQRISSQGYGASRPVASNATREGKAQNRRVEIVILP